VQDVISVPPHQRIRKQGVPTLSRLTITVLFSSGGVIASITIIITIIPSSFNATPHRSPRSYLPVMLLSFATGAVCVPDKPRAVKDTKGLLHAKL
jgi:predicted PurR-regulated permease PerM